MNKRYRVYYMANKRIDSAVEEAEDEIEAMETVANRLRASGIPFIAYNAVVIGDAT